MHLVLSAVVAPEWSDHPLARRSTQEQLTSPVHVGKAGLVWREGRPRGDTRHEARAKSSHTYCCMSWCTRITISELSVGGNVEWSVHLSNDMSQLPGHLPMDHSEMGHSGSQDRKRGWVVHDHSGGSQDWDLFRNRMRVCFELWFSVSPNVT